MATMGTRIWIAAALLALGVPQTGSAAQEGAAEEPASGGSPPELGLGDLLRPRQGFEPSAPRTSSQLKGGKDELSWREAFDQARSEVTALEGRVASKQAELRSLSGDAGEYSFSPIQGGEHTDPEVQRLRSQLKRDRQSLETARSRLRDLEVEASLAGVPDAWRDGEPD